MSSGARFKDLERSRITDVGVASAVNQKRNVLLMLLCSSSSA